MKDSSLLRGSGLFYILIIAMIIFSCKSRDTKKTTLPDKVPGDTLLTFTGPEKGWPPRPAGATNVKSEEWIDIGLVSDTLVARLVQIALQDQKVKDALSSRYIFLSASQIEEKKDDKLFSDRIQLTFFSYDNNNPVEVTIKDNKVFSVERKNYQPPAGREEIKAATRIALSNRELSVNTKDLLAEGILSGRRRDNQPQSHRVIYIVFSKEAEDDISYYAYVDMTDQKLLESGKATAGVSGDTTFKKNYLRRDKSGKPN